MYHGFSADKFQILFQLVENFGHTGVFNGFCHVRVSEDKFSSTHLFFGTSSGGVLAVRIDRTKMTTYISILRGINVSGQKLVKMDTLRVTFEKLGFQNVTTYVQSGNVVFSGKAQKSEELAQIIARQINKDFGFEVPVIVMTIDRLKNIIDNNPFVTDSNKEKAFLHVTFLSSKPGKFDPNAIEEKKSNGEEFFFTDNAVYLYCPNGYGKTKLNNTFLETKLKVPATTRNWKTTHELLKIALQTK